MINKVIKSLLESLSPCGGLLILRFNAVELRIFRRYGLAVEFPTHMLHITRVALTIYTFINGSSVVSVDGLREHIQMAA